MVGELLIQEAAEEWREHCMTHEGDLGIQMRTLVTLAREKELGKLQTITIQACKDAVDPILNRAIYEVNPEFWDEIREPLLRELSQIANMTSRLLLGNLTMSYDSCRGVQLRLG